MTAMKFVCVVRNVGGAGGNSCGESEMIRHGYRSDFAGTAPLA